MKVNLLHDSNDIMSGYVNIDPYSSSPDVVIAPYTNLDDIADDAQCTEIIARDVIDYVPADKVDETLKGWIKKMRHGASIVIGGADLLIISMKYFRGEIDANAATGLLYGSRVKPHLYKKNCTTLPNLVQFLKAEGLQIELQKYDNANCRYTIKAVRP